MDLLNELRSQLVHRDICQALQLTLLSEWSNHGVAVTFFEERLEQTSDTVLLVNSITETFLILECLFQVFPGGNWLRILVNKLESEITHNPHQCWEVLSILFGVSFVVTSASLDLNVLCQIDDKGEIIKLGLINRLLAVVNEIRCK